MANDKARVEHETEGRHSINLLIASSRYHLKACRPNLETTEVKGHCGPPVLWASFVASVRAKTQLLGLQRPLTYFAFKTTTNNLFRVSLSKRHIFITSFFKFFATCPVIVDYQ